MFRKSKRHIVKSCALLTVEALEQRVLLSTSPTEAPIFSAAWKSEWNTALLANNPWAQLVISNAQLSGTSNQRYSDNGDWGVLAYQMTGNSSYADKAWGVISQNLSVPSLNDLREYTTEEALMYYGLGLGGYWTSHASNQQTLITAMNSWCDAYLQHITNQEVLNNGNYTVGALGVTLWGLVSQGANAKASQYLSDPRLGGLTPTGQNEDNVRNAVSYFVSQGAGGQWMEGTDYSEGTLKLLLMATEAIKTVTGADYFPEVEAFYPQVALSEMSRVTPDLQQAFQWGDEEHPRDFQGQLYKRMDEMGMLAGVTQNDPSVGPYVQQFVSDLASQYGYTGYGSAEPWGRFFYLYDPQAPTANWRTLPPLHDASGKGFTFFNEGNGPTATFVGLEGFTPSGADHSVPSFTDFQIYRDGEWAVTHPIGYLGNAYSENTLIIGGAGKMAEASGRIGFDAGPGGTGQSYVYSAATTGGNYYYGGYYAPPTDFVQEATRSQFYLPDGSGGPATLILFDRLNVNQPSSAGNWAAGDWSNVKSSPLEQLIFHSPVSPTINSSGLSWTTSGGQDVQVNLLTPGLNTSVVNESSSGALGGYMDASELNYYTSVTPSTYEKWHTYLSVVQTYAAGTALANTRVLSTAGDPAEGVLVHRPGHNDALVMFNAKQGSDLPAAQLDSSDSLVPNPNGILSQIAQGRFHEAGFTVPLNSSTNSADVYLVDLDPSKQWTATVDGVSVAITVSSAGVGHLTASGSGAHVVVVSPGGAVALAVATVNPGPGGSGTTDSTPTATFNLPVDPQSLSITLKDGSGNVVAGAVDYDPSTYTATFAPFAPLSAGAAYTLTASAGGLAGGSMSPIVSSFTAVAGPQDIAPAAPSALAAAPVDPQSIALSWTDNSTNETSFLVERSTDGSTFTQVGTATAGATSYSDSGLTSGTTYYYRVRAANSAGDSAYSNTASAVGPAAPVAPAAPTNLAATPGTGYGLINLSWTESSMAVTAFLIERSTDGVNFSQIASVASNLTSYVDSGLAPGSTYTYRVRASNAGANSAYSTTASAAAPLGSGPFNLFTASTAPNTPDDPSTTATELGVKFKSDVAGTITGIRFYKGPTNTGTHTAHLWTDTGTLLATATFTGETASGWQQVLFSSPVTIQANTVYVASYFAPKGHYAEDDGYFADAGRDSAPLHALKDGIDGPDGAYSENVANGTFPTSDFLSANYYVDVVFSPTPTLPSLISTTINDGTAQRSAVRTVTLAFSEPVNLGSGAVTLSCLNTGGSGMNDGSAPTDVSAAFGAPTTTDGGLTWVFSFLTSDTSVVDSTGSLGDGIYTITINAAKVTDSSNNPMAGGNQTTTFHRLFGDFNGDKIVNNLDYLKFNAAFLSSAGRSNFNSAFDYNGDGTIDNSDYLRLKARFLKQLVY